MFKKNKLSTFPFPIRDNLMIVLQVMLCVVVLLFAVIMKNIGGDWFAESALWYFDHYNQSLLTDTHIQNTVPSDKITVTETSNRTPPSNQEQLLAEIQNKVKPPLQSGKIVTPFGVNPKSESQKFHREIEIQAPNGSDICSILDGTVTVATQNESYGRYVVITHQDNIKTVYAHCQKLTVKVGDSVTAGQKIATVGNAPYTTRSVLHFELLLNGVHTNPTPLFGEKYA